MYVCMYRPEHVHRVRLIRLLIEQAYNPTIYNILVLKCDLVAFFKGNNMIKTH